MNFFTQQDRAKRKTVLLLTLLVAAVLCLIAVTVVVIALVLYFAQQPIDSPTLAQNLHQPFGSHLKNVLDSPILAWTALGVGLFVSGGSVYKLVQLGGSGHKVAQALGGRPLMPNTDNGHEKKLLNVVEEMAIASGNPVPPVYLLEEPGINAFAAGTDRRNAVIGVTRGCMERLSRDELQGVIAHEFSHIHFGDMKINLRLVALLHGILVLGLIGYYLLRTSFYTRNKNRQTQLGIGLALVVLGFVGVFFGNLIKAAVSRQREYLADASAVQFTRNPTGISGALKKIGGLSQHAVLTNPHAAEYSHLYFGQGVKSRLGGLTATHPPLSDRIRRIEPGWDGQFTQPIAESPTTAEAERQDHARSAAAGAAMATAALAPAAVTAGIDQTVGNLSKEDLTDAQQLINSLPEALHRAAHEPFSARALVYGLLLDAEPALRERQIAQLKTRAHPATYGCFEQLLPLLEALPRAQALPLLELAIPSLKMQSKPQYEVFRQNMVALIKIDGAVSLFEWCLLRIVTLNCEEQTVSGHRSLQAVIPSLKTVLSLVIVKGGRQSAEQAIAAANRALSMDLLSPQDLAQARGLTLAAWDEAANELARLKPLAKPRALKALAAAIQADNQITAEEGELFRALADTLNCPVPLHSVKLR